MGLLFSIREKIRMNPIVSRSIYLAQSLVHSNFGRLTRLTAPAEGNRKEVALCLRFRDEAPYLAEWIEYHAAAGVDHFFLYNNYSTDDYQAVLAGPIAAGLVTLLEWSRTPASPSADEDCIRRTIGKFQWVGFLDADEFVVVRDGRSIGDILASYHEYPAVALNWRFFGSNGHRQRPRENVIVAYTRAATEGNNHVKCFVRPEAVAEYRNPHSWYYRNMKSAINEMHHPVSGSISQFPSTQFAWINHYYCKSMEDYLAKAKRGTRQDKGAIRHPSRQVESVEREMAQHNDREDRSAIEYYATRCAETRRTPILLKNISSLQ
jgi:hypothetical protein